MADEKGAGMRVLAKNCAQAFAFLGEGRSARPAQCDPLALLEADSLWRWLQALIRGLWQAKQPVVTAHLCGGKVQDWLKRFKRWRPGSGGGAAIRVSGMRVGGPARLTLLRGQRITVASASAQAVTKVFAGAVQLVT